MSSHFFGSDCAEKLFDLVDGFAESTKRKAAVWPLQIILLVLCPEIIQDIAKDVVEENKMNKVKKAEISSNEGSLSGELIYFETNTKARNVSAVLLEQATVIFCIGLFQEVLLGSSSIQ